MLCSWFQPNPLCPRRLSVSCPQRKEADTLREQLEASAAASADAGDTDESDAAQSPAAARAAEAEAAAAAERSKRAAMEERLSAEVDVRVLLTTQLDKLQIELSRVGNELSERERSQDALRVELEVRETIENRESTSRLSCVSTVLLSWQAFWAPRSCDALFAPFARRARRRPGRRRPPPPPPRRPPPPPPRSLASRARSARLPPPP